MDLDHIKPNSHKYKATQKGSAEKRKVEKIATTGAVKIRKKNPARKFTDIFISDDVSNVKSYILMDVIVPTVKKLIFDTIRDGAEMLIYGETRRGTSKKGYVWDRDYISYDRFSEPKTYRPSSQARDSRALAFNYEFEERGDAENVLMELRAAIKRYGFVSIGDLTDMLQITGEYTDNKYGWTNLDNAGISRSRDGWVLDLPKARPLE